MILKTMNKKIKGFIIGQAIFMLASQGMTIYLMEVIAEITDAVVAGSSEQFFTLLPTALVFMTIQILCYYFEQFMKTKGTVEYAYQMRNSIYQKLIYAKKLDVQDSMSAHVLNFYNTKLDTLQAYVGTLAEVLINPLLAFFTIFYIGRISVKLLLVSCILTPISSYLYSQFAKPMQKKTKEIFDEKEELNSISKDILDGFYILKAYDLQPLFFQKFKDCSERLKKREQEKDKMNSVLGRVFVLLRYIPQLIIPLYGGYLSYCGELSIGQLIQVNTIIWYVLLPLEGILTFLKSSIEVKPIIEEVKQYDHIERERDGAKKQKKVEMADIPLLEINDLCFSYDQKVNVLNKLSLQIKRAEHIAIIGKSGAGKSTLIKILCGLESEYLGEVKLDGMSLKEERNSEQWRKKISYVPQNPYLFEGTILENITMGKESSMEEVIRVAKLADAHEFINSFPEKYDTKIGNGGLQLSGGQRKKIAIARAIFHDGELFILDEPMSAFDAESTKKVKEGLALATKEKGLIMISHVFTDYDQFERVITMEGGYIYESI